MAEAIEIFGRFIVVSVLSFVFLWFAGTLSETDAWGRPRHQWWSMARVIWYVIALVVLAAAIGFTLVWALLGAWGLFT